VVAMIQVIAGVYAMVRGMDNIPKWSKKNFA
jgi:hypothetical protein